MKLLDRSILGTGWAFPPTFSRPAASVEMASDDVDVRQSLWILLSTALGERIMLPQYGCAIWQLVFRNVTTGFKTQVAEAVRQAIVDWEPRVDLGEVDVTSDATTAGLVLISISYTVRRTNARSNLVYPFYLQEGTLVAQEG